MRLNGWQLPLEHLSASSLTLFIQCPEQFRLRKIKKIPESTGVEKFIGIVDHATHAANFKRKIDTMQDFTLDRMHGLYNAHWDETIAVEGEPEWKDGPDETHQHGQQIMQVYHEQISPTILPLHVEERFEQKIPGLAIPIVGYIDVEERSKLIERKTVKSKLSKPKPKWLLQGRLYSLAYQKDVEWHVVTRAKTPQVVTPEMEPGLRLTNSDHDGTVTIILQAAELLNDTYIRYGPNHPWPTNGVFHDWMCSYCGFGPKYGKQCVAWKET